MGIKFLCPHGHKLNVKSFLAGKKGVCPECGERFVIPLESTPQRRVVSIGASTGTDAGTHAGTDDVHSVASAAAVTTPAAATWPAPNGHGAGLARQPTPLPAATAPSAHFAHAAPTVARADPVEEAPQAAWYVRPPTGGQFGPAKGELLRRWIAEGRVSADSLVWREGWTEWQPAGGLLLGVGVASSGMLAQAPAAPATSYPSGPAAPVGAIPTARPSLLDNSPSPVSIGLANATSPVRPTIGKRPRSPMGIVTIITLALITMLLLVALVWVIRSN